MEYFRFAGFSISPSGNATNNFFFISKTLLGIWMLVTAAVVYNFFVAIYRGPGFVKLKWVCFGAR